MCQGGPVRIHKEERSCRRLPRSGWIWRSGFQMQGAYASGRVELRKKVRRDQVLPFFSQLQPCVVPMEASGGAHFWGREIGKLGHVVRLISAAYVKSFVKRQKNDAAGALRAREKRRDLGGSDRLSGPRAADPAAHSDHQRPAGPSDRVWADRPARGGGREADRHH